MCDILIKVTPRIRFKSPTESISAKKGHLNSRSDCVQLFIQIYGYNPLVKADFRMNPILYGIEEYHNIAMFPDIGSW